MATNQKPSMEGYYAAMDWLFDHKPHMMEYIAALGAPKNDRRVKRAMVVAGPNYAPRLYANDEFLQEIGPAAAAGVLVHEWRHVLLDHHGEALNPKPAWRYERVLDDAHEVIINDSLEITGYELPEDVIRGANRGGHFYGYWATDEAYGPMEKWYLDQQKQRSQQDQQQDQQEPQQQEPEYEDDNHHQDTGANSEDGDSSSSSSSAKSAPGDPSGSGSSGSDGKDSGDQAESEASGSQSGGESSNDQQGESDSNSQAGDSPSDSDAGDGTAGESQNSSSADGSKNGSASGAEGEEESDSEGNGSGSDSNPESDSDSGTASEGSEDGDESEGSFSGGSSEGEDDSDSSDAEGASANDAERSEGSDAEGAEDSADESDLSTCDHRTYIEDENGNLREMDEVELQDFVDNLNQIIADAILKTPMPDDEKPTENDLDRMDQDVAEAINQSRNQAFSRAGTTASAAEKVLAGGKLHLGWLKLLQKINPDVGKEDGGLNAKASYNWARPRRTTSLIRGVHLPTPGAPRDKGAGTKQKPVALIALDFSRSIDRRLAHAMKDMAQSIPEHHIEARCITFSTYAEPFDFRAKSNDVASGGTDFSCIELEARKIQKETGEYPYVICLTDGEAWFNGYTPNSYGYGSFNHSGAAAPTQAQLDRNWLWVDVLTEDDARAFLGPSVDGHVRRQLNLSALPYDRSKL